ncbi:DNA methyltransferase [Streptomyces sp. H27-C3]|uniref:Eco57I restriction-modification methylase domain-containing protein n=1 Tax=Streptomyces sp. H27-C3 TaxID=3046305 RepID=UPI0024BB064B|nr:DNA methyltransferase [Streptomyces sp. H27-C3]MDJ0464949.1 hypothetical protein [Streptomyces sp. H27-C3]
MLDGILETGLTPTVTTDYARWKPLHWVLAVPDVMERGGFDAIVGNPPFRGSTYLSGDLGANFRDWLVNVLAAGQSGSADIVAYFFLRAHLLLTQEGGLGLIATNTVAQGVTRKVGLEQIAKGGFTITRSIQSRPWPATSANLEFAACWGSRGVISSKVSRVSDGIPVERISTLLEPGGRVEGEPVGLVENVKVAFQGCNVLGKGFVLDPVEAADWIGVDSCNKEVLYPYPDGKKDIYGSPNLEASRWVIDFNDRTEFESSNYHLPYQRVLEAVKPERARNKNRQRRELWWRFTRNAPAMREAIAPLDEVIIIIQTSATQIPVVIPARQVFSHKTVVIASQDRALLAVLSSSIHRIWATCWGSTRTGDPVYTPKDVFLTFPRPDLDRTLSRLGDALDSERREIMIRRSLGVTKLYNLVNDPDVESFADRDIARLRQIHTELDSAVMEAYGWGDVLLNHGFHTYRQMERWTVDPNARVKILDRLLQENHRRAAVQGVAPLPSEIDDEEEDDE